MNKYIVYIQRDSGAKEVYEVVASDHEAARQMTLAANPNQRRYFAVAATYKGNT